MHCKYILLLLIFVFGHHLWAQQQLDEPSWLTVDDGLSAGLVTAITQDCHGLNRYDGYNFTIYKNIPFDSTSISGNFIAAIYESRDGTMWVGTHKGLNIFDREKETFQRIKLLPEKTEDESEPSVVSLAEDSSGAMWVGTLNAAFFRIKQKPGGSSISGHPLNSQRLMCQSFPRFAVEKITPKTA